MCIRDRAEPEPEPVVEVSKATSKKGKKVEPVVETKSKKGKKAEPESDVESDSESEPEPDVKPTKGKTTTKAKPANVESDSEPEEIAKPITKSNKKLDKSQHVVDTESDSYLENLLNEKKQEWAIITAQIHAITQERERLEIEQKNLVRELTELMSKLKKDTVNEGFTFESPSNKTSNKSNGKSLKQEIISMDAESDSDTSDSDSDSDSDDGKLKTKKGKVAKPIVKTTKGPAKGLKLSKPGDSDSDSESDEDSD
jgi:hypothetical protein